MAAHGGQEAVFDSFVEPSALVLSKFLTTWVRADCPDRAELLARANALKLPKNPLDTIVHELGGPKHVAEMTGRNKRFEQAPDGSFRWAEAHGAGGNDAFYIEQHGFQLQ